MGNLFLKNSKNLDVTKLKKLLKQLVLQGSEQASFLKKILLFRSRFVSKKQANNSRARQTQKRTLTKTGRNSKPVAVPELLTLHGTSVMNDSLIMGVFFISMASSLGCCLSLHPPPPPAPLLKDCLKLPLNVLKRYLKDDLCCSAVVVAYQAARGEYCN